MGHRQFGYVGPTRILDATRGQPPGVELMSGRDLRARIPARSGEQVIWTYVVSCDGVLVIADRHREHVVCAGRRPVLTAGELITEVGDDGHVLIVGVSNQSTGYCPDASSFPAFAEAARAAGLEPPDWWTFACEFRRCGSCGALQIVKDEWFVCWECEADLPLDYNVQ